MNGDLDSLLCLGCGHHLDAVDNFCSQCGMATPRCSAPARFQVLKHKRRRGLIIASQVLLVVAWLTCVVGMAMIIVVDVESVVASGPLLFISGVALMIVAGLVRYYWAMACAAGHIVLPLFWTLLVVICEWSPSEAYWPFVIMGCGYLAATTAAGIFVVLNPPRLIRSPWECVTCGYLLYGLESLKCPECGTPFVRPHDSKPIPT